MRPTSIVKRKEVCQKIRFLLRNRSPPKRFKSGGVCGEGWGAGVQWTPLRSRSTDRGGSREFPVCGAPTEAVDLRGRGGSLCPPVKWNHPQSKSNSFGMNYRREGMEPLPYTAVVRFLRWSAFVLMPDGHLLSAEQKVGKDSPKRTHGSL